MSYIGSAWVAFSSFVPQTLINILKLNYSYYGTSISIAYISSTIILKIKDYFKTIVKIIIPQSTPQALVFNNLFLN